MHAVKPLIIAELSCNHLGSERRAHQIVEAAAAAGADLFKVQVWQADTMCIRKDYRIGRGPWEGRLLFDLYREAYTPWEWLPGLFDHCRRRGMEPFGAAFDWPSVDYLCQLGVQRLKVASFELTDIPLIRYMASKDKPMILSTGMATEDEIHRAVDATLPLRDAQVTVLKCTSAYPARPESMNLAAMRWDNVRYGLSDHTLGHEAAVIATALGASMIEKHLTLSRKDGGPDAGFSLEPQEFKDMVQAVRRASLTLGEVKYGPQPEEDTILRRSLWVVKDISEGEPLRFGDNVVTARPALGLPPSTSLTGKRAARALAASTPLKQEDVA
jgi:pseudaminic acid synthase